MASANKRVLVFDDEEDLLVIFRFLFEEQGWEVHTAENCDNVLEKARAINPHLILMDNWIPSAGGLVATQLLKKDDKLKHIPVIYISANNDVKNLAAQAGADSYMTKPFDFTELYNLALSLTNNS